MMVAIRCPNPTCSKSFQVSEEVLGRTGHCKQCGTYFILSESGDGPPSLGLASESASCQSTKLSAGVEFPDRLGRFEIRACLGAGAFGTVYRAYDPVLNREVALKVPRAGMLQSPGTVKRFLRGAQSAADPALQRNPPSAQRPARAEPGDPPRPGDDLPEVAG
jgi:hypothetical protein